MDDFLLMGRSLFMRGELDGGSAPLTGYAPMDKNEWLRIFRIGKKHGLNHTGDFILGAQLKLLLKLLMN